MLVKILCSNKKKCFAFLFVLKLNTRKINFFLYADLVPQLAKLNGNNLYSEKAELFFPNSSAASNLM